MKLYDPEVHLKQHAPQKVTSQAIGMSMSLREELGPKPISGLAQIYAKDFASAKGSSLYKTGGDTEMKVALG